MRGKFLRSQIPTGFNHSAQGCEERATLGPQPIEFINPERVEPVAGMRRLRMMQPRWGWNGFAGCSQGSPAGRANPGLND